MAQTSRLQRGTNRFEEPRCVRVSGLPEGNTQLPTGYLEGSNAARSGQFAATLRTHHHYFYHGPFSSSATSTISLHMLRNLSLYSGASVVMLMGPCLSTTL